MLMKSIGGTDVVGLRRCLEVTRQRRRRFARAFIDLHAHAGVLTHGASKKSFLVEVQPRRCSRRRARALGSGEDGNRRLLQGPRCNFYFLQVCLCKAADIIFTTNK